MLLPVKSMCFATAGQLQGRAAKLLLVGWLSFCYQFWSGSA